MQVTTQPRLQLLHDHLYVINSLSTGCYKVTH